MQPPDMQEPSRHAWRRHAGVHLRSFGDEPLALAYDTRLARTHLIDELAGVLLAELEREGASLEQLCQRLEREFDLAAGPAPSELGPRVADALQALAAAGLVFSEPLPGG